MIAIWDEYQAKQYMQALYQQRSLKIPPFQPVVDLPPSTHNAGEHEINPQQKQAEHVQPVIDERDNDRRDHEEKPAVPQIANDEAPPPLEAVVDHKEPEEAVPAVPPIENEVDDEDMWHCLTDGCHKKGQLNVHNNKEETTRLDCAYCGVIWCVQCGVPWHLGQNCQQFQADMMQGVDQMNDDIAILNAMQQQQEEIMNMKANGLHLDDDEDGGGSEHQFQQVYEQQDLRTCPNCKSVVDKTEGCNHMTCFCGTHFCWLCEQIVDENALDKHYDIGVCALNDHQPL